ncbi:AcrB/AcrD/AcrF family protein [Sesbania bispinosa]|nr:AcrB/AcrD/AcrF family protein [Sesbania bispinosa]
MTPRSTTTDDGSGYPNSEAPDISIQLRGNYSGSTFDTVVAVLREPFRLQKNHFRLDHQRSRYPEMLTSTTRTVGDKNDFPIHSSETCSFRNTDIRWERLESRHNN